MRPPTVRIYLTANLAIYLLFGIMSFPEGLGIGFIALLYSFPFSAPTLLLLYSFFLWLKQRKFLPAVNWLLLFATVSLCGLVPVLLFSLLLDGRLYIEKELLLISLGSAFAGTFLQGFYINKYFKFLQHKTDLSNENN